MKFYTLLLFLLMSAVPARADPQSENVGIDQIFYLEQTDAAIRDGRLTQAGEMITWLELSADKISRDDVQLLKAEYAIAMSDVAAAHAALSAIKDQGRNICRQETVRGWVSANRQALDDAIISLATAAGRCPQDAGVWNLLGLAFMRKGETAAARKAFGKALLIAPANTEIMNNHAIAALQNGDVGLAFRELTDANLADPQNNMISANRDFVSGMLGLVPERGNDDTNADWSERLIHFARGAKAASRSPEATTLFARALLVLDHFDESLWSEIAQSTESAH